MHVKDELDAGHTECTKEGYNMKKSRQGRITLRKPEIMKNGPSRRVLYLEEACVDRETKTDGVNEKRQYHRQHTGRFRSSDRKDTILRTNVSNALIHIWDLPVEGLTPGAS